MNSSLKLNYETRPIKFVERKMLLACLSQICNYHQLPYQYIGFGGLAFTDFKLFHTELHINDMYSIEGGDIAIERIQYNCPYSFIQIKEGLSSVVLPQLTIDKPTIVWLDYDGRLDEYMFEDIDILFSKLPAGSIYIMSCNRELKRQEGRNPYNSLEDFKDTFGARVPYDIEYKDLNATNGHKTIRTMLYNCILSNITDRNIIGGNIKFKQLFNILYEENIGARMFTYGGIILEKEKEEDFAENLISRFSFLKADESTYEIKIPNLTLKETELINKNIKNEERSILLKRNIIQEQDIIQYKEIYKYYPHFFDVRV